MNWIDDAFNEIAPAVETPDSWLWWSLVCAISASASNNYYIVAFKGNVVYKPNLYVMLLGESGLGKAHGINIAKLLVQKADCTRVIAGRSSIQAIITELAQQKTRPDGKAPIEDSRGFIVNGELSSALIGDPQALQILTDLYDGNVHPDWTNSLKTSGKEKLKDPCITALFGSSLAHFYDTIPQANIEGGYIGRNLMVFEEKRSKYIDPLDMDDSIDDKIKGHIIPHYSKHLTKLARHKAKMQISSEAKELYNNWRRTWRERQLTIRDPTRFVNRVPDHVLKVGMCLNLANYEPSGIISRNEMDLAILKVTSLIHATKMTTAGRGIDPLAAQARKVIEIMLDEPQYTIRRRDLLDKGHGNFDSVSLDRIIVSYEESNWVKKTRYANGSDFDWIYTLQGQPIEAYGRVRKT